MWVFQCFFPYCTCKMRHSHMLPSSRYACKSLTREHLRHPAFQPTQRTQRDAQPPHAALEQELKVWHTQAFQSMAWGWATKLFVFWPRSGSARKVDILSCILDLDSFDRIIFKLLQAFVQTQSQAYKKDICTTVHPTTFSKIYHFPPCTFPVPPQLFWFSPSREHSQPLFLIILHMPSSYFTASWTPEETSLPSSGRKGTKSKFLEMKLMVPSHVKIYGFSMKFS